jgi:hypothetical protein
MRRRMLVAGIVAVLFFAGGCAAANVPFKPTPDVSESKLALQVFSLSDLRSEDASALLEFATPGEFDAGSDTYTYTRLTDLVSAAKVFPEAVFPRETFNRRLIGVKSELAKHPLSQDPLRAVSLLYEGQLRIDETYYQGGFNPSTGIVPPGTRPRETTTVAGVLAEIMPTTEDGAGMAWTVGHVRYSLGGGGLSVKDVVLIARSMRGLSDGKTFGPVGSPE